MTRKRFFNLLIILTIGFLTASCEKKDVEPINALVFLEPDVFLEHIGPFSPIGLDGTGQIRLQMHANPSSSTVGSVDKSVRFLFTWHIEATVYTANSLIPAGTLFGDSGLSNNASHILPLSVEQLLFMNDINWLMLEAGDVVEITANVSIEVDHNGIGNIYNHIASLVIVKN